MPNDDEWDQYKVKAPADEWGQYKVSTAPAPTSGPIGPAPVPAGLQGPPSMFGSANPSGIALGAGEIAKGAGKSAIGHVQNAERLIAPSGIAGDNMIMGLPSTPSNGLQKLGGAAESVGEFMIPFGGPEEGLASMAIKGLGAGAVNKAQGGSFLGGAALGAGGDALAQGAKKLAPQVFEQALKIGKGDRIGGRTPGQAGLAETTGINPSTIERSANERLNGVGGLNSQLDNVVKNAPGTMSLRPARDTMTDAMLKAVNQGEPTTAHQLFPMGQHLAGNVMTGVAHPEDVAPIEGLRIKRGFGNEFVHNWKPETTKGVNGTAKQVYGNLNNELIKAVPEAGELNQRISSLIPVQKAAESVGRDPGTVQTALQKAAAHTGALAPVIGGSAIGYNRGGLPGAIVGGVAGAAAPALLTSPSFQVGVARGLNGAAAPAAIKGLIGTGLTLKRATEQKR